MKEVCFISQMLWIFRCGTGTIITYISNSISACIQEVTPGHHRERGPGCISGISYSVLRRKTYFFHQPVCFACAPNTLYVNCLKFLLMSMTDRLCLQSVIQISAFIISFSRISSAEQPTCSLLAIHLKVPIYITCLAYLLQELCWLCSKGVFFPWTLVKRFTFVHLCLVDNRLLHSSLFYIFKEKFSKPFPDSCTDSDWDEVNFLYRSQYNAMIQICE